MAGFKTHITTSTVLGVGYAGAGFIYLGAPLSTCVLAGGLCSVSGMLPDLDSDSGVPVRETMAFAAAVVPMLMMDRFEQLGWSRETMVFVGGLIYLTIRFGVASIFKKYTVHRGMWHSIPAAAVVGLLAFLICSCEDLTLRGYKASAVVLGFMSHLVLDEIWSLQVRRGRLRVKRSFGTALKLWGRSGWANLSVYAKLGALIYLVVVGDPALMERYGVRQETIHRLARQAERLLPSRSEELLPGEESEAANTENAPSPFPPFNFTRPPPAPTDGNSPSDSRRSPLDALVPTPIKR